MSSAAFVVRRTEAGRFAVCSTLPGTSLVLGAVEDCPTIETAEKECAWRNAEHDRLQHADHADARLRGAYRTPFGQREGRRA